MVLASVVAQVLCMLSHLCLLVQLLLVLLVFCDLNAVRNITLFVHGTKVPRLHLDSRTLGDELTQMHQMTSRRLICTWL